MASIKFTPQDYTSTLAMLNHEGANGILALMRAGRSEDAMGYVSGLIDTWNNRAAARGIAPWEMMNRPSQISFWEPDKIQSKANALDPRIKDLADAYLTARANGAPAANPTASFYLNKDLVEATPSYGVKWKRWYEPGTVVSAYGDKRGGGKGSLETQFVQNDDEYKVPEYSFSFDPSLKLSPKSEAQTTYNNFAKVPVGMGYDPTRALNTGSTGLNDLDVSQGVAPGMIGDIGRPIETGSGTDFSGIDASGNVGPGSNNLGGATPLGPPPGPYDFANGGTPGGVGDPNFGGGIDLPGAVPAPLLTPAPTVGAPAGTATIANLFQSILGRPADAPTLSAFDAELDSGRMDLNAIQAALAASPEAQTLGAPAPTKTYSPLDTVYARQFDRAPDAAAVQNWGNVNGADIGALEAQLYGSQEAQTYRAGLGDLASLISPGTVPTIGAGGASGTIGAPSLSPTLGPNGVASTLGPTNSVTAFDPGAYLSANKDVAAAGLNPLEHYLRYGQYENRDLNLSGQKFDAASYLASSPDVAAASMSPLQHYLEFGSKEGRQAQLVGPDGQASRIENWLTPGTQMPTNLAEILNTAQAARMQGPGALTQTIGANTAQTIGAADASTIGPQGSEFAGTFNPTEYLTANQDVAAAGMDPLQHYLKYGFAEGRAINPGGAHINQAFDPSAYLQQNPDVAAAKLDPLAHFLLNGASEGRAAPTGSNPYSFSNFNVSQGLGPVGPGAFGLSGVTGGQSNPLPGFGGQNVSQGVPNGSFGAGISPYQTISPFGFSGANVSGGLGATAQSLGGSYGVTSAMDLGLGGSGGGAGSSGDGTISPYGFGGDVSGFDVNGGGGGGNGGGAPSTGFDDGSMAAAGFDEKGSELAFLRGQEQNIRDMNESAKLFGQQITNVAPGNQTNYALGAINTPIAPIQQTPFTPVNMSGVFAPMPTAMFMPRFTF